MQIKFSENAWKQYIEWQSFDKRMIKRINDLLKDISRGGHSGIGKPEPLLGELSGYWSRRIDFVNRLVYRLEDDTCTVIACKGHYE